MISAGALEEAVLVLLVHDKEHAPALACRLTADKFTSRVHQTIATAALDYILRYKTAPGLQMEYLLEAAFRRGDEGKLLGQTINILATQAKDIQASFVLEQFDQFLDQQNMTVNMEAALECLHRGDMDEAKAHLDLARRVQMVEKPGIWLSDSRKMFSLFDQDEDEFFSSGVDVVDRAGCIPARKTLSFMIASSGKGKSWWLAEVAKRGLQHHKKTLIITLEMAQETWALRLLMCIFSMSKKEVREIRAPRFSQDANGATSIDFQTLTRSNLFTERRNLERKLSQMKSFPKLLIKEFPTAQLTTQQLDSYLEGLDRDFDFRPDLIVLDYADLMKLDSAQLRIDTGRNFRELRGIAVQRNAAVVTASQGNRESDTAKTVDRKNVAEDWSKIGTADNVYTYSQTPEEHRMGLARFLCAKGRNERDRFMALISQSYEIGQFSLDSVFMQADVSQEVERVTGG